MNKNEIRELSMEEKELVNGGTVEECSELQQALSALQAANKLVSVGAHTPVVNLVGKAALESDLSSAGIDADLSVGFLGTGIGSSPNKYYRQFNCQGWFHLNLFATALCCKRTIIYSMNTMPEMVEKLKSICTP